MINKWNIKFDEDMTTPPNEIVEDYCENLKALTDGKIVAKIADYSVPISSYSRSMSSSIIEVDIQDDLGPSKYFSFEFFITSTSTPNYKYRIMFIRYEIEHYPLLIVLDGEIATYLNKAQEIWCKDEEEFKIVLQRIVESPKVRKVINNLYRIGKKDEQRRLLVAE